MLKILGVASLLVGVACGGSSSSNGGGGTNTTGSGSCATNSGGMLVTCTDFGAGFTATTAMQNCTGSMTTYSAAACPSANRVGRCEITETSGSVTVGDAVNFYPPETAALAMQACNMENGLNGVMTKFVAN
jgi:hypothetical protein